jgi:hypothetical protein
VHSHFLRFYASTGNIKGAENLKFRKTVLSVLSFKMPAIPYFKICAQMNQSLISPFTQAEIVNATLKARYCVK